MARKFIKVDDQISAIEIGILKKLGFSYVDGKLFFDEKMIKADRSSVGSKSRRKGGTFERVVATALSMWWTNGADKNVFSKTPASGAWRFPLDLVPPEWCPLLVSCKNEESWEEIQKVLTSSAHRFGVYWAEIHEAMNQVTLPKGGRSLFEMTTGVPTVLPVVIFTKNMDRNYLMIRRDDFNSLRDFAGTNINAIVSFNIVGKELVEDKNKKGKTTHSPKGDGFVENVVLMTLDAFMQWVTPEVLKEYAKAKK